MTQIDVEYINRSPYKLGQFGDQLESMTAQEVFNITVEHLLLQNKKSTSEDGDYCMYKGSGVCCAAAPFIKSYNIDMEHRSWLEMHHTSNHLGLICELQSIHDSSYSVIDWPSNLEELANEFRLEMPQILIDKLNTN